MHSMKTDDVFFVYGLPEFKFLYKAGVRGEGPDDFGFVQKIQSADGDGTGIPVTEFTKGCTSALVFGGDSVTSTDVEKLRHFPMALRIDDSLGVICTIKKTEGGEYIFRTNRRFGSKYANDCGKCGNQMGKVGR